MNLNQLLSKIDYDKIIGQLDNIEINNVKKPDEADEKSIIFIFRKLPDNFKTKAKVIVTKEKIPDFKYCQVIHRNPRLAMAEVLETLFPLFKKFDHSIHSSSITGTSFQFQEPIKIGALSVFGDNVSIGEGTIIHSNVSIGNQCERGKNCIIHPNTTIYDNTKIGDNTIIHGGVVIGADGFGYEQNKNIWEKINHLGSVVIGNNVEIGANSCIDRGVLGQTSIANGVKIDNLVQVAHNCEVSENTIIIAGALLGGSSKIGKNCILAGDVCVSDGVTVNDNTTILARSGVTKNHHGNQILSGYPAINHKEETKHHAKLRRLLKKNI